mmetsp:Transcript_137802/g.274790  ORF Transcript_137802/g.274790 Transcript_137802/m.274790 type:complete len:152 (-) Transcript_137802:74-529(-)|eukprot:CAMPEP_0172849396 /NCGR_PEP_ID=MMETSP1075-20121228/46407_1 /TAXON_ID=2916 /ORGANISM="Ceratium fusus, Strain PA161109" /LENGTH=151 /DNA_ID=CAMNT_0013694965 /DNA_START=62 /DNA_END=517 /DNA_ORIENTATION=+
MATVYRLITRAALFAILGDRACAKPCDRTLEVCDSSHPDREASEEKSRALFQNGRSRGKCNPARQECGTDEVEDAALEASMAGETFIQAKSHAKEARRQENYRRIGEQLSGYNKGVHQAMDSLKQMHGTDQVNHHRRVTTFHQSGALPTSL